MRSWPCTLSLAFAFVTLYITFCNTVIWWQRPWLELDLNWPREVCSAATPSDCLQSGDLVRDRWYPTGLAWGRVGWSKGLRNGVHIGKLPPECKTNLPPGHSPLMQEFRVALKAGLAGRAEGSCCFLGKEKLI